MTPDSRRTGPRTGNRLRVDTTDTDDVRSVGAMSDTGPQLRRRRAASYRLEPLDCGARDPLDLFASQTSPSTYGLTPRELQSEAQRMRANGWRAWEVRQVLDLSPAVAA